MEPSESVETQIRHRIAELEQFYPRITAVTAVFEAEHRHHHSGRLYRCRLDVVVPGRTIHVGRNPAAHHAHEDAHVAIRDAFDAARRQIEDHVRQARGDEKTHEAPQIGRITEVFPDRGYAFLITDTGEEIYVHRNSVVNGGFDKLTVGGTVRYALAPDPGEKGPQASTVVPLAT